MKAPLIVIVGETGSGKTALGIHLAHLFNGEIISADSRTIYQGMDIGTAKPTIEERAGITHHGFDLVKPDEPYSAYDFQNFAYKTLQDIRSRGKLPILVGGTGLYVDAVIYEFNFRSKPSVAVRSALEAFTISELQQQILNKGLSLPRNALNRRHLTRLLESGPAPKQAHVLPADTIMLGLSTPADERHKRLAVRVDAMVANGLVEEVASLYGQYGELEALRTPGYKAFSAYLQGKLSLIEAKNQFVRDDLRLAKKQRTWFKRDPNIHWLEFNIRFAQAEQLVKESLSRSY